MCQLWVTTCLSCSSSPSPSVCLQNVGVLQTPGAGPPYSELIRRGPRTLGLGCVQGFEVMDVTRSSPEFCADSQKFFSAVYGKIFQLVSIKFQLKSSGTLSLIFACVGSLPLAMVGVIFLGLYRWMVFHIKVSSSCTRCEEGELYL